MTRITLSIAIIALASLSSPPTSSMAHGQQGAEVSAGKQPGVQLESLLHAVLEGVEGTEVVVSRVTIPPHSSLPRHWHPGEEFAYVLEGSVTLWQEGKEDTIHSAGEVAKVPLKQVHTAITSDQGATILVFRVHEQGEPERILVEGD